MNSTGYFILVTGNGPQTGKTTVRFHLAEKLGGVQHCATSDMILPHLEIHKGIKAADVLAARLIDPEAYRRELIEVADTLREEYQVSFTLDAYYAGNVVVDGGRKVDEIRRARKMIESFGVKMLHIHLVRDLAHPGDNTEVAIDRLADLVLENSGTLDALKVTCWLVAEGFVNEVKELQDGKFKTK